MERTRLSSTLRSELHQELKILAVINNTSMSLLLDEAVEDLFKKYIINNPLS